MRLYMEFEPSGTNVAYNLETSFPHELTKEQATSMFRSMLDTATAYVQTLGLNTSKSVNTSSNSEKETPKKATKQPKEEMENTND